jgi:hypothetical protein
MEVFELPGLCLDIDKDYIYLDDISPHPSLIDVVGKGPASTVCISSDFGATVLVPPK